MFLLLVICDLAGDVSGALDTDCRNQQQAQGVQPAKQTLQSSLVDGAGQGGDRETTAITLGRNRHPPRPSLTNSRRGVPAL